MVLGSGDAAIHLSADSRDAGKAIPIDCFQPQGCLSHQVIDAAVEIAAAGQAVLQRVETILPASGGGVVATAMLKEQEVAIRFQNPPDFA